MIHWHLPFIVIDDTSTPNIIKSYHTELGAAYFTSNMTKEYNTKTNTTTYRGESGLFIPATARIADAEFNVTLYPNATGIVELKEV